MMDGKLAEKSVQKMAIQMVVKWDGTKAGWKELTKVSLTVE